MTLKELALRMRCSRCGRKAAEVVAVARPRPRGVPKNPHWTQDGLRVGVSAGRAPLAGVIRSRFRRGRMLGWPAN